MWPTQLKGQFLGELFPDLWDGPGGGGSHTHSSLTKMSSRGGWLLFTSRSTAAKESRESDMESRLDPEGQGLRAGAGLGGPRGMQAPAGPGVCRLPLPPL